MWCKMIISFFGHRDFFDENIKREDVVSLIESKAKEEPVDFYLGQYGEFDAFAYDCAKLYKEKHPTAKLYFITPYIHPNYSRLKDKERFDGIIYPEIENAPKRYAISRRNKWIVEHSNFILFYIIYSFGGAITALKHAENNNIPYINLAKNSHLK